MNGWKKIRTATPSQIQLCPRDMTADVITVDIAPRNLAEHRHCCAELSTCESQLTSHRAGWSSGRTLTLFYRESYFSGPTRFLNARRRSFARVAQASEWSMMFRERDLIFVAWVFSQDNRFGAIEQRCASFLKSETDSREPFSFSGTEIPRSCIWRIIPRKIAIACEQKGIPIRIIARIEIFFRFYLKC